MEKKTFIVMGLGTFGNTLAKTLAEYGHNVIPLDKDMDAIEQIADYVDKAVCLDYRQLDQLRSIGVSDADCAIITSSSKLDDAIMGILNSKDLGVPYVVAKAKDERYAEVLKKIGADETINPEMMMAKDFARRLVSTRVIEITALDAQHAIFDIHIPSAWVGKNLIELDLRNKYNVNIIAMRRNGNLHTNVNPRENFQEKDELLLIGENNIVDRYSIFSN